MSVVENADQIIVLNNGLVEEKGRHNELMQRCGLYAELVKKQNMGFYRQQENND